jgi:hypothetical protein
MASVAPQTLNMLSMSATLYYHHAWSTPAIALWLRRASIVNASTHIACKQANAMNKRPTYHDGVIDQWQLIVLEVFTRAYHSFVTAVATAVYSCAHSCALLRHSPSYSCSQLHQHSTTQYTQANKANKQQSKLYFYYHTIVTLTLSRLLTDLTLVLHLA